MKPSSIQNVLIKKKTCNALLAGKKSIGKKLTTIKPFHTKLLLDFYNQITSEAGSEIIVNGWKSAGIWDAIQMGKSKLRIDPFDEISPLISTSDGNIHDSQSVFSLSTELRESYVNERNDDDDVSEWGDEDDFERSEDDFETKFYFIIDEE